MRAILASALPHFRTDAFHHIFLLASSAELRRCRHEARVRGRAGACASRFLASRLWICCYARPCASALERSAARNTRRCNQVLKQGVSRGLIGEAPRFWQKRYYDFNVHSQEKFQEKLRYTHRNPVKKELCARPGDWQWSSFRHYATGHEGIVEIESAGGKQARKGCRTTVHTHLQPHPPASGKNTPLASGFSCSARFSGAKIALARHGPPRDGPGGPSCR